MINIVVISHGNMAKELIESATMIVGKCEAIYSITLQPGDSPGIFTQKLDSLMSNLLTQETLILIDMFSGTPYNIAARYVVNNSVECITGVNLPILIEAILTRENSNLDELAILLTKSGVQSIKRLKSLFNTL